MCVYVCVMCVHVYWHTYSVVVTAFHTSSDLHVLGPRVHVCVLFYMAFQRRIENVFFFSMCFPNVCVCPRVCFIRVHMCVRVCVTAFHGRGRAERRTHRQGRYTQTHPQETTSSFFSV